MPNFENQPGKPVSGENTDLKLSARRGFVLSDRAMAGTIIGAHTLNHIYSRGFYVIIPLIYRQLRMVPIEVGLMDAVRWVTGGFGSISSGFFADIYRHRRGLFLGLGILIVAVGYFLVSLAPNYGLILLALAFAHVGSSIWHPAGIGLISERFPGRRGLLIALHRSTGSLGATVGPVLVGLLLVVITWQQTLQLGLPLAVILSVTLLVLLWNVGSRGVVQTISLRSQFWNQMASLRKTIRGSSLLTLLAIAALSGMGNQALFLFLPLYLAQTLKMGTVGIGFHLGLLSLLGIASGPVLGTISDRVGRKLMIAMVLLVSAVFPLLMLQFGTGVGLTISIAFFGLFLYQATSLVQAAAMDIAHGMKLEGTFIGMLWGIHALFGAISPIIAGALVGVFGFPAVFYYATALFLIGGVLALCLRRVGS